jgi:tRNA(adenine34) deaminase
VTDADYMGLALDEARRVGDHGDVPIGCVVVAGEEVLGAAGNERELRGDPTAHAEILALQAAAQRLGSWRLDGASVYVTLEPCPMCAGALVAARVARLVYGPPDPKAGAALSLYNIVDDPRLNHSVAITTGVRAEECTALLAEFFVARRRA